MGTKKEKKAIKTQKETPKTSDTPKQTDILNDLNNPAPKRSRSLSMTPEVIELLKPVVEALNNGAPKEIDKVNLASTIASRLGFKKYHTSKTGFVDKPDAHQLASSVLVSCGYKLASREKNQPHIFVK